MTTNPASPARLTLADARDTVRALGLTLAKRDGEYRVNFRGGSEDTAYYTDCLADAVDTARAMAAEV